MVNEAGIDHARLVALADPSLVFTKGTRLHAASVGADDGGVLSCAFGSGSVTSTSAGDGAWVMKKCCEALRGSCSIEFAHAETTFRFSCPTHLHVTADQALRFAVPPGTIGIGIDDSQVQRAMLRKIFSVIGVEPANVIVLGDSDESMLTFGERLLQIVRDAGERKVVVIADENLELVRAPRARARARDGCARAASHPHTALVARAPFCAPPNARALLRASQCARPVARLPMRAPPLRAAHD